MRESWQSDINWEAAGPETGTEEYPDPGDAGEAVGFTGPMQTFGQQAASSQLEPSDPVPESELDGFGRWMLRNGRLERHQISDYVARHHGEPPLGTPPPGWRPNDDFDETLGGLLAPNTNIPRTQVGIHDNHPEYLINPTLLPESEWRDPDLPDTTTLAEHGMDPFNPEPTGPPCLPTPPNFMERVAANERQWAAEASAARTRRLARETEEEIEEEESLEQADNPKISASAATRNSTAATSSKLRSKGSRIRPAPITTRIDDADIGADAGDALSEPPSPAHSVDGSSDSHEDEGDEDYAPSTKKNKHSQKVDDLDPNDEPESDSDSTITPTRASRDGSVTPTAPDKSGEKTIEKKKDSGKDKKSEAVKGKKKDTAKGKQKDTAKDKQKADKSDKQNDKVQITQEDTIKVKPSDLPKDGYACQARCGNSDTWDDMIACENEEAHPDDKDEGHWYHYKCVPMAPLEAPPGESFIVLPLIPISKY